MRKLWPAVFVPLMFGCSAKEPQIKRLDGSQISNSELTNKIQTLVDTAKVAGLSVAIFNDNTIRYQESFGFANLEKRDALTNNMVFYGASLSKSVFGYLVSQLISEGLIDLDRPLQEYLDQPLPDIAFEKEWRGFKNLKGEKRYEKITGRMCLSHTTGFPNWRWISKEGVFIPEGKIRFLIDPGTRYNYSGEGIHLLQFVVERIIGKGLEELAQERIFGPLQMDMTSYIWRDRFEDQYCNGHTSKGAVIKKDTEDEAGAAGSMETTLVDYTKFVQHILNLSEGPSSITNLLFEPNVLIKSKTQFGIESWQDTDDNDSIKLNYGLGWGLLSSPHGLGAFKEGHGEGFQHYSIVFPEMNTGIIILSNSDNAESIFKELLEVSIGDIYTPWKWENYIPFDDMK